MVSKGAQILFSLVWATALLTRILPLIIKEAYVIRLGAIEEFGPIIHEFDPYFNLRATEYLYEHGYKKFFTWFDYKSWYPLGRPVGTTIYPGMQFTAVFIKTYITGDKMSLNDVCCYIPAWFGAVATIFTMLLAYECSLPTVSETEEPFTSIFENIPIISLIYTRTIQPLLDLIVKVVTMITGSDLGLRHRSVMPASKKIIDISSPAVEIALIAGCVMAVIPAHLMRSIGGGYDNESVAMTSMSMTFYLWCRSVRGGKNDDSIFTWLWGALAGLAYFYMAAVWGGYVFVINLIGVHAGVLVLFGRFSTKLYRAYTAFYLVGTILAMQIPVVGWTPLKSLEQLGPCAVFIGYQLIGFVEYNKRKYKLSKKETWMLRIKVFACAVLIVAAACGFLIASGYFGPISSRVRGLFVKHTKTGNPLVDSVAEHQPATDGAYAQYLDNTRFLAPIGMGLIALRYFSDSSSFLLVFGLATYFFSLKMVRLILLTAPIVSVLSGIVFGRGLGLIFYNIIGYVPSLFDIMSIDDQDDDDDIKEDATKDKTNEAEKSKEENKENESTSLSVKKVLVKLFFVGVGIFSYKWIIPEAQGFRERSHSISAHLANPSILIKGTLQNGEQVVVDDYRECYWWLRDNTPEDARVLAWWDYGYQISAIAKRTTIADGNTWNHEHIALLGRILTASEKEGHRIARHLADYALVWGGGGGDDLAKSPHLARIANSVYRNHCPGDTVCSRFGYQSQGVPSRMMKESFLYKLHSHRLAPGVVADPNRFKEVFSSKYGKCRIFKIKGVSEESKAWVADPANKICDAPGSWYCRGQYPPALNKILKEKTDFSQLEDFNKGSKDSDYQKEYFEGLKNRGEKVPAGSPKKEPWKPEELSADQIDEINKIWDDNEETTVMWEAISNDKAIILTSLLSDRPELAHIRSSDGRGPMFWAMEYGNEKIIRILKKVGVSTTRKDKHGLTPLDLMNKNEL